MTGYEVRDRHEAASGTCPNYVAATARVGVPTEYGATGGARAFTDCGDCGDVVHPA